MTMSKVTAWLKSKFISIFIPLISIAYIFSIYQCYNHRESMLFWTWLFAFLAITPIQLFFLRLLILPVARTSANLSLILLLGVIGSLCCAYFSFFFEVKSTLAFILAFGISVAGVCFYVFWYSSFGNRKNNSHLKVGAQLPSFELEDPQGNVIHSSGFMNAPALFIFYRGNWCPLCMAQIKEVAGQYKALADRGVEVVLVSPQSHENSESLAKKFDVPFKFLVDKDNKVARQLELLSENGTPTGLEVLGYDSDTVMPTVLISDATGKIIFADLTENYRVRPEPETFLKVLTDNGVLA